jgi:hypothetical protein
VLKTQEVSARGCVFVKWGLDSTLNFVFLESTSWLLLEYSVAFADNVLVIGEYSYMIRLENEEVSEAPRLEMTISHQEAPTKAC